MSSYITTLKYDKNRSETASNEDTVKWLYFVAIYYEIISLKLHTKTFLHHFFINEVNVSNCNCGCIFPTIYTLSRGLHT